MKPSFTIGIEEEFQVVDPATRELRSHIAEIFAQGQEVLKGRMKPELHQPVVEIGTEICRDIHEARRDVTATRAYLARLARENGLRIAAAGTHPFSHWASVEITGGNPRYERLVEELQMVARANLIFGLHVHIGVEDREAQIRIMNQVAYFLPHVLTLAVNSPFWLGRDTGWMSYRCKVFDKFPRTNIPDTFTSWADYETFVNLLVKTNSIDNAKKIWWDVRPHPFFS
ncbi:MAG TPA: YbdK family carboxylate-amine ligase, partial [Patescibacteria group bacterium]|nr:YbdK family carboxylate-amine ligase [Patescibacteria group bacterium]